MNETLSTLNKTMEGQKVIIKKLLTEGTMRRRLQDIGLIEGTCVECLQKSPAGDPAAYLIKGAVIAIRSEDSQFIVIE